MTTPFPVTVVRASKGTHYCGRSSSYKESYGKDFSILGNKYWMKNESMRDEVCEKYNIHFDKKFSENGSFTTAVLQIAQDSFVAPVKLGCFCSPARCHCDRIAEEVIRIQKDKK